MMIYHNLLLDDLAQDRILITLDPLRHKIRIDDGEHILRLYALRNHRVHIHII